MARRGAAFSILGVMLLLLRGRVSFSPQRLSSFLFVLFYFEAYIYYACAAAAAAPRAALLFFTRRDVKGIDNLRPREHTGGPFILCALSRF